MFKRSFKDLLKSNAGKYIISILLGLGLASLFRKSCEQRNCIIFRAPNNKEIEGQIYKQGDKCFKYNPHHISCGTKQQQVNED